VLNYLFPREDDLLGKFINHEAASSFLDGIQDPIVQSLVRAAYQTHLLSEAEVEGEFDLLYFIRIMEEFLRNREKVSKTLMGDFSDETSAWGT
jgi:hypothetical protein